MEEKIIFRELLQEIKNYADTKDNVLTAAEIKEYFKEIALDEDKMKLIYEYLESQKISIEGRTSSDRETPIKEEEPEEDGAQNAVNEHYLQFYLEELKYITPLDETEIADIYPAIPEDELCRARTVEGNLHRVVDIAKQYTGRGVSLSDLIQEGNVGLMLAVEQLDIQWTTGEKAEYLEREVHSAMEGAIEEHKGLKNADKQIVSRANHLKQAVKNLEEDLERKVSIEELSAYLEMPLEEIRDILRMAGDEIELEK